MYFFVLFLLYVYISGCVFFRNAVRFVFASPHTPYFESTYVVTWEFAFLPSFHMLAIA